MAKSAFEQYQDLIEQEALFGAFGDSSTIGNSYNYDDEDNEDFLTSSEIVKMKQDQGEADENGFVLPTGPIEIEEDVHFKRYTKRREYKYTESEMNAIRQSCETTIVHDYGENDVYHISDEERAKNDTLAELRMKLNGLKKTYRQIDKYIEAMRVVVDAWELLESKDNYMHSKERFFEMVSDGFIYSNSIIMPRMKGLDKYNMDLIINYISNPELDPKDLVKEDPKKQYDSWYDQFDDIECEEESEEDKFFRLISLEEAEYLQNNVDSPPEMKVKDIKPRMIKGYDRKTFDSKKKNKKLSKKERYAKESLHDMLRKIQSNPNNREGDSYTPRTMLITNSIFEPEKKEKSFWDDLRFDGSWANDDDVFIYDLVVSEEIAKQRPVGERYMTYGDKELQEFFKLMESNGINVMELRRKMNMTTENMQQSERKKVAKQNKKTEAALLQRITKLNNNPKFKKLVTKAEKAINEQISQY